MRLSPGSAAAAASALRDCRRACRGAAVGGDPETARRAEALSAAFDGMPLPDVRGLGPDLAQVLVARAVCLALAPDGDGAADAAHEAADRLAAALGAAPDLTADDFDWSPAPPDGSSSWHDAGFGTAALFLEDSARLLAAHPGDRLLSRDAARAAVWCRVFEAGAGLEVGLPPAFVERAFAAMAECLSRLRSLSPCEGPRGAARLAAKDAAAEFAGRTGREEAVLLRIGSGC